MSEPLIVGEQLILGDYGSNLTSISTRDGVENWLFADAKSRFVDTPLLVGELLIAPNADKTVYAVDLGGSLVWKFSGDGAFWARPASDGKLVFIPSLNHKLYALDVATGGKTWEVDLNSPLVARPLYAEGIVFLGNLTGEFFAIDAADGSIKWTQKVSGGIWAQPILQDGKLYFGDQEGKLNILTAANGKINTEVDAGSAILGSGVNVPEGIIFGTENGKIILFDAEGKSRPLLTLENGSIYSNIIVNGERMIVLAYKGNKPLIALDLNGNEAWYYSTKK
jgi:outer membrane protein assembly factor BamB